MPIGVASSWLHLVNSVWLKSPQCLLLTESEKIRTKIYTRRMAAYWPGPEPTLTGWFISALDPLQNLESVGLGAPRLGCNS